MLNTIELNKRQLTITLYPATVIHADKYEDSFGFGGRFGRSPYYWRRLTDVVFRSKQSGRDWKITTDVELPVYTSQDVTVIGIENSIIGYIDTQTKKYVYTTGDFAYELDFGVPLYINVLLGLGLSTLTFFMLPDEQKSFALLPACAVGLFHIIQRRVWNYRIEKALDKYLAST